MTGGTGGIGSKVAKKLLKAGIFLKRSLHIIGAIVVLLCQDQAKVEEALKLKD